MANTSTYAPGNRFERVQTPPYFQANNRPFWPSLTWSTSLTLAADEPLHITRPVVQPEMVPIQFFNGELDGLLIDSISVRYTGAQNSVNTLFIYDLFDFNYYCIGAIALPVSTEQKVINIRGAYSPSETYVAKDSVTYQGTEYVALQSTTGNLPTNTTFWRTLAYQNTRAYVAGNVVSYEGEKYIALSNTTGNLPTNPTFWRVLLYDEINPTTKESRFPQPESLLDTEDNPVLDSFGQPVTVTSVMGQGDPGSMLNPGVLLGANTLRYATRLMDSESIYLGIAQELTTPIVVSAWGQRYSKLERIAAATGGV